MPFIDFELKCSMLRGNLRIRTSRGRSALERGLWTPLDVILELVITS